jgi:hypothetical protein
VKSTLITAALLMMALAGTPVVHSSDGPDRPPGVTKDEWIPINERVGFVVVQGSKRLIRGDAQPLLLRPAVPGYFMLKGSTGWSRIVIVEPPRGPGDAG